MKSLEELAKIREQMKEALKIREGVPSATCKAHIMVCGGQGCISSKCGEVVDSLKAALQKNNLTDKDVKIILTGCLGPCDMGPVMILYPDATFYRKVKPKDAEAIVEEHILKGRPRTAAALQGPRRQRDHAELQRHRSFQETVEDRSPQQQLHRSALHRGLRR